MPTSKTSDLKPASSKPKRTPKGKLVQKFDPEFLTRLRALFVAQATFDAESGKITGVSFFPPSEILRAREMEMTAAVMSKAQEYDPSRTAEIDNLRARVENATDVESRKFYEQRLAMAENANLAYYSS